MNDGRLLICEKHEAGPHYAKLHFFFIFGVYYDWTLKQLAESLARGGNGRSCSR